MQNLNKTPITGTFGDVAKVLDTNFGLVVAKLIELEQSHRGSNVGFYASESALKTAYPSPTKGLMAFVGTGKTYTIYRCTTAGTWTKTSETFTFDTSVDLSNYTTIDTFNALKVVVDNMVTGATYMGAATTSTNPGTPSVKVVYLASASGTYANFGGLSVAENEIALLYYNGSAWVKNSVDLSSNIAEIKAIAAKALEMVNALSYVSIDSLDTVLGSTPNDVYKALLKSNGKPLRYIVYYSDYIVGMLEMFGDSLLHCMTQVLTTNYIINSDGTITSASAHDHKLHTYARYYNIRWSGADWWGNTWAAGTWTKWHSPIEDVEANVTTLTKTAATLQTSLTTETTERKAADENLQTNIDNESLTRLSADKNLQTNIDNEVSNRKAADTTLQEGIDAINNKVGAASGIAPLNDNTMVDDTYLPKEVLEISGFVEGVDYVQQSAASIDSVVFDTERNTFFGKKNTGTELKPVYKYYNNWDSRKQYCADAEGEPYTEKIYTDGTKPYYYNGTTLVAIGADSTEKIEAETAERKAADAKLQEGIDAIGGKFVSLTQDEYDALTTKDENTYYTITEE